MSEKIKSGSRMTGLLTVGFNESGIDAGELDFSIACARVDDLTEDQLNSLITIVDEAVKTICIQKGIEARHIYSMENLKLKHQLTQLKQFAREASRVAEFYGNEADYFDGYDHKDDYGMVWDGNFGVEVLGKTARQFLNSDIYKQVKKEIEE